MKRWADSGCQLYNDAFYSESLKLDENPLYYIPATNIVIINTTVNLNYIETVLNLNMVSFLIQELYPRGFRFYLRQVNPVSKRYLSKSMYICWCFICCPPVLFYQQFYREVPETERVEPHLMAYIPPVRWLKRHKRYTVHLLWSSPHSTQHASHHVVSNILQKFLLMKPKWQEITSSSALHFSVSPAAVWK